MGRPDLLPGEFAWRCRLLRLGDDGRVTAAEAFDAASLDVLKSNARRLYLEVVSADDGGAWLMHRAGWPFDLRIVDGDPIGKTASELRPTGAGDEVMRDLIESFESAVPKHTLHVVG